MKLRYTLVVIFFAIFTIGCASTGARSSSAGSSDIITAEQIQEVNATDAYELVRRLRPAWLRQRGVASINRSNPIVVYMDGVQMGGVGFLRQISLQAVSSIQHLDSSTATQRFGTGHVNGAILVSTR